MTDERIDRLRNTVRAYRLKRSMSQRRLAENANIGHATVRGLERNYKHDIKMYTIRAVFTALRLQLICDGEDLIRTDIGGFIEHKRTEKGLSHPELSKLANMSYKNIIRIERGQGFEMLTLLKILDALGLELEVRDGKKQRNGVLPDGHGAGLSHS